jgi:hypothetical protein
LTEGKRERQRGGRGGGERGGGVKGRKRASERASVREEFIDNQLVTDRELDKAAHVCVQRGGFTGRWVGRKGWQMGEGGEEGGEGWGAREGRHAGLSLFKQRE